VVNPENTFFSVKRFIGRRWEEVGSEAKEIPYTVKNSAGNVKIECKAANKDFAAEEISAQVPTPKPHSALSHQPLSVVHSAPNHRNPRATEPLNP
jgi:molecular chaperone DnaK (HSP70)